MRLRDLIFGAPLVGAPLRRAYERGKVNQHSTVDYWERHFAKNLHFFSGGWIEVDTRCAQFYVLIRGITPNAKSVLDVGCAAGALALWLGPKFERYVGVDISKTAIEAARTLLTGNAMAPKNLELVEANLKEFQTDHKFGVIVFGEVLFYLNLYEVERQIDRYLEFLAPGGLVIVSLKRNVVSKIMVKMLCHKLRWVHGMIFQEQIDGPEFSTTNSETHPAIIQSVFKRAEDVVSLNRSRSGIDTEIQ